jgi:SAM-dependent methyltransferase
MGLGSGGYPGPIDARIASHESRPTVAVNEQRWAVDLMAISPHHRVLEIGCGQGGAVSLIAGTPRIGKVTAIDRSSTAVRRAIDHNRRHITSGTAEILRADFTTADLPAAGYDKVFAINVSLFWLDAPPRLAERVLRLLAPGGHLYVFSARPRAATGDAIAHRVVTVLGGSGLATETFRGTTRRGWHLTAVVAGPR